jgi:5'-3' exonuclease
MRNLYFKMILPYKTILEHIVRHNYEQVIFHIDLASIARGWYNKKTVDFEIARYMETQQLPEILFEEANDFYNELYGKVSKYNPKFITFYDRGGNSQNKSIDKTYKGNRNSTSETLMLDDNETKIYYAIKRYYYEEFVNRFNIKDLSKVIFLDQYETDLIPYFVIKNNIINSQNPKVLNIILSTDKDLLQTCIFKNTIQVVTIYSKKEGKLLFNIFNDDNAIGYIYKNFKPGILTSKYIPLILAIAGDAADNIKGVPGIGPSKACKLIQQYRIPSEINKSTELPEPLEEYKSKILTNLELISFDKQIDRLPYQIKKELNDLQF